MKNYYLRLLGKHSKTKSNELICDCLDYYKLSSTQEITETQLKEYCELINIIEVKKDMNTKKVKFATFDDVKHFCEIASTSVDGRVLVTSEDFIINGKSILGVLSLDLQNPVNVTVKDSNCSNDIFWEQLKLVGIKVTEG